MSPSTAPESAPECASECAPEATAPSSEPSLRRALSDSVLIVAGEASGDLHAARLLSALSARRPSLHAYGLGGGELEAAGLERLADSAEISVVGIVEVLKIYRRAKEIFDQILAEVDRRGTRTAVLVDFPDFNLRLARQLRRRGLTVIYYISPQVWAWRKRRIVAIARDVDLMLVLFPFEESFYRQHDVAALHVGHPLVEEVPTLPQRWEHDPLDESGQSELTLALLPGSRRSEVRALLPTFLASAGQIARSRPVRARLIQAPTVAEEFFDDILAEAGWLQTEPGGEKALRPPENLVLERVRSGRFPAVADSHLALCASGTATLEVALLGTPMLVLYKLKWTSYALAKILVDLPHFCMVNLVLGREVVPELLQAQAEPVRVAQRALELVSSRDAITTMRAGMAELRPALGEAGASDRAAAAVLRALDGLPPAHGEPGSSGTGSSGTGREEEPS